MLPAWCSQVRSEALQWYSQRCSPVQAASRHRCALGAACAPQALLFHDMTWTYKVWKVFKGCGACEGLQCQVPKP